MPRLRRCAIALTLAATAGAPALATTFTVLTTADSGSDSLRGALTAAQDCTGSPHTIAFAIPEELLTDGVAIITPATLLPSITCLGTTVDGTTQTSSIGNTNDVTLGTGGTVGTGADGRPATGDEPSLPQLNGPEVEIVGSALASRILEINASSVTIRGLSLHGGGNFAGVGTDSGTLRIAGGIGALIEQNVIGASAKSYTLPAGAQSQDNLIMITGGGDHIIEENLLGFVRWRTILLLSSLVGSVTIRDNEIAGIFSGIDFSSPGSGPNGLMTITRNLIRDSVGNGSGFTEFAIFITQTGVTGSTGITHNTIRNVDFGTLIDAARPVLFQHNIVSGSTEDAVIVSTGAEPVAIDRNSLFDNLIAIDLGSNGVSANEGLKIPAAPNDSMDYPVFTSASVAGGTLSVAGYVGNVPGDGTFPNALVQLFKADNAPANQRGEIVAGDDRKASHGEGAVFIATVTADLTGQFNASFPVPAGVTLLAGDAITATATDGTGNTSEFGPNAHLPIVLDIDANGVTDPLTDGLLIVRFLFGFTGPTLINGVVGGGCQRCTADAIASHLTGLDLVLDIDDNDAVEPLSDGLMILRFLFGFSGSAITNGAVGAGCGRCDATAITPYAQSIDS